MLKYGVGLIGCGVMGRSLALNIASQGLVAERDCSVAVYDKDADKLRAFVTGRAADKNITGVQSTADLIRHLQEPRWVLMMIPEGDPVDQCIDELRPLLQPGDVLIDAGNSHYGDTCRRAADLEKAGTRFLGIGVSGGQKGALKGPSIMVGGTQSAWEDVKELLRAIAAKTEDGPCCDWVGETGAGHFVKMVHNGIEYGNMQMICEVYHVMKVGLGMSLDEMSDTFDEWSRGPLQSYLIEITRDVLRYRDKDGDPLLEVIRGEAGQKGTGKRAAISALQRGQPFTAAASAVFARFLSANESERVKAGAALAGAEVKSDYDRCRMLHDLPEALLASTIVSYAQGFQLLRAAGDERYARDEPCWDFDLRRIAQLWRKGCVIRSAIVDKICTAFKHDPNLTNLLLESEFANSIVRSQPAWRRVAASALDLGIPIPAISSALSYYDSLRSPWLPTNLLQAMRDYFGAHGYERSDRPRGELFHTDWTGKGGETQVR